jgi:predicted glycosyltransferase involved in capsule biosynthesis
MLRNFLASYFESDLPDIGCNLIVVDFMSVDINVYSELIKYSSKINLISCGNYFNRCLGLQNGFDNSGAERVFFIDVDMAIPQNFGQYLLTNINPGKCIFPVCYSFLDVNQHTGHWREWGVGNCGFMRKDFYEIGGWNQNMQGYGFEDTEIFIRSTKKLTIVRERLKGFYHRYHPDGINWKTQYHSPEVRENPAIFRAKNFRIALWSCGPISYLLSMAILFMKNWYFQNPLTSMLNSGSLIASRKIKN